MTPTNTTIVRKLALAKADNDVTEQELALVSGGFDPTGLFDASTLPSNPSANPSLALGMRKSSGGTASGRFYL